MTKSIDKVINSINASWTFFAYSLCLAFVALNIFVSLSVALNWRAKLEIKKKEDRNGMQLLEYLRLERELISLLLAQMII